LISNTGIAYNQSTRTSMDCATFVSILLISLTISSISFHVYTQQN